MLDDHDDFATEAADLMVDEADAYLNALNVFVTIAQTGQVATLNEALLIVLTTTGANAMITDNPDGTTDVECRDIRAWGAALAYSDILNGVI